MCIDAIHNMQPGDFYPSREADVFVEAHRVAGGGQMFTVWNQAWPLEVNLDAREAAEAFDRESAAFAARRKEAESK